MTMYDVRTPDRSTGAGRTPAGSARRRAGGLALVLGAAVILAGCDLSVSNPGPVTDEFLDDELAQPALVNSIGYAYLAAFNRVAYQQIVVTGETTFAGQTGAHGFSYEAHTGYLDPENVNVQWDNAQQARWVADDAVERLREVAGDGFSTNPNAAQALLWQGYAYRLLGENFCDVVIDGGEPRDDRVAFEHAEAAFTEARDIAQAVGDSEIATAAAAGRASVRIWLDNWEGALQDAAEVPADFVFEIATSGLEDRQHNRIYWGSSNNPWRAHSVVNTFYEDYYLGTGDPRTSWDQDPEVPHGNAAVDGEQVPWYYQTKYTAQDDPYPLSTGTEMRLIEAEAELRDGNVQEAMDLINGRREDLVSDHDEDPIPLWDANGELETAWTHLKRERGIELWLEGRRLGDMRRWIEQEAPGETDDMSGRSLCYPIPDSEREQNPNVPLDFREAPTG